MGVLPVFQNSPARWSSICITEATGTGAVQEWPIATVTPSCVTNVNICFRALSLTRGCKSRLFLAEMARVTEECLGRVVGPHALGPRRAQVHRDATTGLEMLCGSLSHEVMEKLPEKYTLRCGTQVALSSNEVIPRGTCDSRGTWRPWGGKSFLSHLRISQRFSAQKLTLPSPRRPGVLNPS